MRRPRTAVNVGARHAVPLLAVAAVVAMAVGAALSADLQAPVQVFAPAALHCTRLDNGLRLVVMEDHSSPLVAVNIVIRAGVQRETPGNNGVSHFLEHMVFRAARMGDTDALAGPIEAAGGVVNGGALRDFTSFRAVTASAHLRLTLDALAQAVLHPAFDDEAVFAERVVIMRETEGLADRPQVAVWDLGFALAFGDHPYAMPIGGTRPSLVAINADTLADFHRRWYVPDNAAVVIVGDVEPAAAQAAAARAFSAWKGPRMAPAAASLPSIRLPEERRERMEERDIPQAVVLLGFVAPGIAEPRSVCAMDLLLTVLSEGYTSPLKRALLDSGLATEFSADFLTQKLPGLFGIRVTCAPERVAQVRQAVEAELLRLHREPLTDDEMTRVRRRLEHSYAFANETVEDEAETLGFYEAIATYEFAVSYLEQARSLSAEELQTAARKYLDPAREIWVAIMPLGRPGQPAPGVHAGARR